MGANQSDPSRLRGWASINAALCDSVICARFLGASYVFVDELHAQVYFVCLDALLSRLADGSTVS